MPKKYISIPDPVSLKQPNSDDPVPPGKPITFLEFVRAGLFNDPRWISNYNALCSRAAVDEAIRDAEAGIAILAEEDWKILDAVVQNPKKLDGQPGYDGFHPLLFSQFLPFLRAVKEASDSAPKSKVKAVS